MPHKINPDVTAGAKLLQMFRKLMLDGRRHFQRDLADEFQCSPQTIARMAAEIESVIGLSLETALDNRRRYYQIRGISRTRLGLEFEEVRYLSICRDLAANLLPEKVIKRVSGSIFELSLLMTDQAYADRARAQKPQLLFFSKGRIDYTPHQATLDKLMRAADEKLVCLVNYRASGKERPREHRFAPRRLVSLNNALYALGLGLAEDFSLRHLTNLAVHRVAGLTLTDRRCTVEAPEADPGAFGLPWHEPKKFRIQFAPGQPADYVRERIWAEEQHFEELADGGLILEVVTRSEPELMAWVRSFGDKAWLL
jgi:predicted DNA-binding transcriptional regulator YafY